MSRVDVLLVSGRKRTSVPYRLRVVGLRSLGGGRAAQVVVLAERRLQVSLPAGRQTWVAVPFPKPISLASAGPVTDQLAIELVMPQFDNSLTWVGCLKYDRGQASTYGPVNPWINVGPRNLDPHGLDKGASVTSEIPFDLALVTYR